MRAWLGLVLLGCEGGNMPVPVDADTTLTYRLTVTDIEPPDRPPHDPAPVVFIDGVETASIEHVYPDLLTASEDIHHVELRHGTVTVAAFDVGPSAVACMFTEPVRSYAQSLCGFASGDLRFGSEELHGQTEVCVGDGFCLPACPPCDDGERCTSRVVLREPLASHLGCAPVGPKAAGDACGLIDDPEGAYDDCGRDLLCVEGTCRPICDPRLPTDTCGAGTCTYVPGHAPELGVCAAVRSARARS